MLLALRDVRTGSFLAPLTATTPGEAERTYLEILRSEGTLIGKYPRDFPLYELGKYDEFTGQVFPLTNEDGSVAVPRVLVEAASLIGASRPDPRQVDLVKEG